MPRQGPVPLLGDRVRLSQIIARASEQLGGAKQVIAVGVLHSQPQGGEGLVYLLTHLNHPRGAGRNEPHCRRRGHRRPLHQPPARSPWQSYGRLFRPRRPPDATASHHRSPSAHAGNHRSITAGAADSTRNVQDQVEAVLKHWAGSITHSAQTQARMGETASRFTRRLAATGGPHWGRECRGGPGVRPGAHPAGTPAEVATQHARRTTLRTIYRTARVLRLTSATPNHRPGLAPTRGTVRAATDTTTR